MITPKYMNNFVNTIYPEKNIKNLLAHILYFKIPMPSINEAKAVKPTNDNIPNGFVAPHATFATNKLIIVPAPIIASIYPNEMIPKFSIFLMSY